jgi:hypothetical protein
MSSFDRRQFLKGLLGQLSQVAGTVVVASAAVTAKAQEQPSEATEPNKEDIQERADRLAASADQQPGDTAEPNEFLNGAFRNTPIGGFRNTPVGGFRNTPIGGFRNGPVGGFRNTPIGAFRNGAWPNGGWGGFHNGGWPNHAWRNWW